MGNVSNGAESVTKTPLQGKEGKIGRSLKFALSVFSYLSYPIPSLLVRVSMGHKLRGNPICGVMGNNRNLLEIVTLFQLGMDFHFFKCG